MAKLKAAILQCDDVLDKFQDQFDNYPEMIIDSFRELEGDIDFDIFDVRFNRYPDTPNEYDFFVITGSKASVYDAQPWIRALVDFVKKLGESSISTFGICFGHQIMALAYDCEVSKSDKGWGVGITTADVSEKGSDLGISGQFLNMIVSHQDQVTGIPSNAEVLAKSDFCPFFAVKWSDSLISIQGHPEWQKGYSEALMNDRRDRIPKQVLEAGIKSLEKTLDNEGFMSVILNFLSKGIKSGK